MPTVHLYVRQQVKTDDPAAIENAVAVLQAAVEATGATWTGSVETPEERVEPQADQGAEQGA